MSLTNENLKAKTEILEERRVVTKLREPWIKETKFETQELKFSGLKIWFSNNTETVLCFGLKQRGDNEKKKESILEERRRLEKSREEEKSRLKR